MAENEAGFPIHVFDLCSCSFPAGPHESAFNSRASESIAPVVLQTGKESPLHGQMPLADDPRGVE